MPGAGRLGDKAQIQADAHGCPGCPHPGIGPAISGSANVLINGRPALRVDDAGIHAACCGGNMWQAAQGSATVFINGKAAHRMNDPSRHCGGTGKLIEGSADVIIGDSGGGGGGGGGGSGGGSSSSSSGSGSSSASAAPAASPAAPPPKPAPTSSSAASPAASPAAETPKPDSWIEIELVDQDGNPVVDQPYEITTSDGKKLAGTTDGKGKARVNWIESGDCQVTFPGLHDWKAG
ncbi:MAG TPA: PAAR domain-containing protein [Polyangia bacterium]|nr:PAAR domain-containing protein [Polyangia bacterium]